MSLLNANLIAFEAVVNRGTVHGAADEVGLSQTGVTQRIRSLENELGATLFTRSRKGMVLTKEGEALHRYCVAAKDLAGATLSQITGAAVESEVQVSLTGPTSIMSSRIVNQCSSLIRDFPNLLFDFKINDLLSRIEFLRNGTVQLAVVPPELVAKEMDSKLLKPEKFLLVGSPQWKGRKIKEIISNEKIIDFDYSDDTSISYLKHFGMLDLMKSARHFVNENGALIKMFMSGIGYGTLNSEIAVPYLERGELIPLNSGKTYVQNHALAWYPRLQMTNYFKSLTRVIK